MRISLKRLTLPMPAPMPFSKVIMPLRATPYTLLNTNFALARKLTTRASDEEDLGVHDEMDNTPRDLAEKCEELEKERKENMARGYNYKSRTFDKEALLKPVLKDKWVWRMPFAEVEQVAPGRKAAEKLFKSGMDYLGVARRAQHVDELNYDSPQIALLGRSNCGKSSLLNALLGVTKSKGSGKNRQRIAHVSKKPGRTDALHVYGVGRNDGWRQRRSLPTFRLLLIDCPGYGYAKVNDKVAAGMSKTIANFLEERNKPMFATALVLVDARRGLSLIDEQMLGMLEFISCAYQIVLTKCDAVNQEQLNESVHSVGLWLAQEDLLCGHPVIIGVSSRGKVVEKGSPRETNVDILRAELLRHGDMRILPRKTTLLRKTL